MKLSLIPQPRVERRLDEGPVLVPSSLTCAGLSAEQERFLRGLLPRVPSRSPSVLNARLAAKSGTVAGAYRLRLGRECRLEAGDWTGMIAGFVTLRQLADQADGGLVPAVAIEDVPAARWRIFQLDLARGMSCRTEFFERLCPMLAELRYNALQLYVEHNFVWRAFPELAEIDAMTPEQAREIERVAALWGITVIPATNLCRHMEGFLRHPRFRHLKELPLAQYSVPLGQLCVAHPEAWPLARTVLDEIVEAFSGPYIHLGMDEAHYIGRHRLTEGRKTPGQWYGQFIRRCAEHVRGKGRIPVIWGDKFLHPDWFKGMDVAECTGGWPGTITKSIAYIPKYTIINDWHYTSTDPITVRFFRKRGFEVWAAGAILKHHFLAPGTFRALPQFLANGVAAGATGAMVTTWGSYGGHRHEDYRFPLALAAEAAWRAKAPEPADFERRYSMLRHGAALPYFALLGKLTEPLIDAFNGLSPAGNLGEDLKTNHLWNASDPFELSLKHGQPDAQAVARAQKAIDSARAEIRSVARKARRHADEISRLEYYADLYQHGLDRLTILPEAITRFRNLGYKKLVRLPTRRERAAELRRIRALLDRLYEQVRGFLQIQRRLVQRDGVPVKDLQGMLKYAETLAESMQRLRDAEESGQLPETGAVFGPCCDRMWTIRAAAQGRRRKRD